MHCPGCDEDSLRVRQRVLVAARAQVRCPACGVAIRFGFWPRAIQSLFGEVFLLAGFLSALLYQSPFLLPLAAGSWLSLALLLPVQPARHDRDPGSGRPVP